MVRAVATPESKRQVCRIELKVNSEYSVRYPTHIFSVLRLCMYDLLIIHYSIIQSLLSEGITIIDITPNNI